MNTAAAPSFAANARRAGIAVLACLITACSVESGSIEIPQISTFDPAADCVDLNVRTVGVDALPKNVIAAVTSDARETVGEVGLYKVLRDSGSNSKVHVVFDLKRASDLYIVYSVDPSSGTVLRKFKLGSLHYPQENAGCRQPKLAR